MLSELPSSVARASNASAAACGTSLCAAEAEWPLPGSGATLFEASAASLTASSSFSTSQSPSVARMKKRSRGVSLTLAKCGSHETSGLSVTCLSGKSPKARDTANIVRQGDGPTTRQQSLISLTSPPLSCTLLRSFSRLGLWSSESRTGAHSRSRIARSVGHLASGCRASTALVSPMLATCARQPRSSTQSAVAPSASSSLFASSRKAESDSSKRRTKAERTLAASEHLVKSSSAASRSCRCAAMKSAQRDPPCPSRTQRYCTPEWRDCSWPKSCTITCRSSM
mmetsp:Transcript_16376/g.37454  ORF Transcript_16376/g.37454 Transcript_16376/m.37454 type:complete len:283 (+) Transcript_16376:259-1107(+)